MSHLKNNFVFEHKRLGISESDVKNCSDRITLLEWKLEVEKDVASINNRIYNLNENYDGSKELTQAIVRAKKYKHAIGNFAHLIALRLSALKEEKRQESKPMRPIEDHIAKIKASEENRTSFPWFFLDAARELLSEELFSEIEEIAKQKKSQKLNQTL